MKYSYPALFKKEPGGYVVEFLDFEEANTEGDNLEEALLNASDCLDEAIAARINDGEMIPLPSTLQEFSLTPGKSPHIEAHEINVSADIAMKAALHASLLATGLKKTALARKLDIGENEVRRMLNPRHKTKLSRLSNALRVIGKKIEVVISDV